MMFAQRLFHQREGGAIPPHQISQSTPSADRFMEVGGDAEVNLTDKDEERRQPEGAEEPDNSTLPTNNQGEGGSGPTESTGLTKMALQNSLKGGGEQKEKKRQEDSHAKGRGEVEMEEDDVITIVPNEENRAEIRVTLKKPSLTMIQQHSLDSAPFKMTCESEKMTAATTKPGNGIRRSSTTPWNNGRKLTMGYKYARRPTEASTSFPVPPVFPKTCSLFDSNFSGGAFADSEEDRKLMDALGKVRRKISGWSGDEHLLSQYEDLTNMSDSGHSSITEGTSTSPTLNHFSFFGDSSRPNADYDVHHSKDSVFFNSTDNDDKFTEVDGKERKLKRKKSDFGTTIRKNSRILFFRQRAKTSSSVKSDKSPEKESEEQAIERRNGDNELPRQPWTIDGSKGLSWKCKLLRTLSSGGIHIGVGSQEKGDKPSDDHFGKLDREWEVVTVRELCRRLSLDDSLEPSELPLPEGALQSQVLDEFMIRQIVDILPPRAEGYPWVCIYSSEKHGFSLATLYRKMSEWKEEMSPVLLVVRDVQGHVFGAVVSTALRPLEHYYGTGDSCLLFRFTGEFPHTRELRTYNWTGNNQFFVNATKDFLSVGAGGGHYGIWLDADLNMGRSQKCATFDNEPLAGGLREDFTVQFVEAFGFSMT